MIQLTQTILHDPENGKFGDCWRTCIACLLDLKPEDVPHFATAERGFRLATQEWLRERGLAFYEYAYKDDFESQVITGCYHILTGPSPRDPENVLHCVIGRDGKVVWDPHPSRAGIYDDGNKSAWYVGLIVRLNPMPQNEQ